MSLSPAQFDVACAAIACRQHGIIMFDQATTAGGTRDQIQYRVSTGRWRRVDHGTYFIAGGPFTWHSRVMAACLGSGGLASHRTAAVLHGIDGFRAGSPEISIARGSSFRRANVRVHESTDLALARPRKIEGIPVTGVDRLLVDLGSTTTHRLLEEAVFDVIDRKLLDWPDVWEALVLHARRGRNGIGALRHVLDANYGTKVPQSKLEIIFERMLDDAGFPRPERQVLVSDDAGPIVHIDYAYTHRMVGFEVDGRAVHARREALEADVAKRNRLRNVGWNVPVFTAQMILGNPVAVCDQIADAMAIAHRHVPLDRKQSA